MCHHCLKIRRDFFAVRRFSILATGRLHQKRSEFGTKIILFGNVGPQNPHTPLVNHDVPHSIAILWLDPTAHFLTNSNVSEFDWFSTWPRNSAPCHGLTSDSRWTISTPIFPHEIPGSMGTAGVFQ